MAGSSLQQKVMGAVESAGPPLCSVPLSGAKESKVLLPASTFERLAESLQLSKANAPKKKREYGFLTRAYRVVGKPQELNQLAKKFAYPADRMLREREEEKDDKGPKERKQQQTKKSKMDYELTEQDFIAMRKKDDDKSRKNTKGSSDPAKTKYCRRHKPQYGLLPSAVRDSLGFPLEELRNSDLRVQKARTGESHIQHLDLGPDLAEVLPSITLFDPANRSPLAHNWIPEGLAWCPEVLNDSFNSVALVKPKAFLELSVETPQLSPQLGSDTSTFATQVPLADLNSPMAKTTLAPFLAGSPVASSPMGPPSGPPSPGHPEPIRGNTVTNPAEPMGVTEGSTEPPLKLPPIESGGVVSAKQGVEEVPLNETGLTSPTLSPEDVVPIMVEPSSPNGDDDPHSVGVSLFANNFQGLRVIIKAIDAVLPKVHHHDLHRKRRHSSTPQPGKPSPHAVDDVRSKSVPPGHGYEDDESCSDSDDGKHGRTGARKREDDSASSSSDNEDECVVCRGPNMVKRKTKVTDPDVLLSESQNGKAILADWRGMFMNTKLHCSTSLNRALEKREATRDLVYQSPRHLSKIAEKASSDACNWSLARSFHDMNEPSNSMMKLSLWREASKRLQAERDHTQTCMLFYKRLGLYLDAIHAPSNESQVEFVAGIRRSLIEGSRVDKQLMYRQLLQAGPGLLESRDTMKIVHFMRLELCISLHKFIQWIKDKDRKEMGWKLTSDLMVLWDKIKNEQRNGRRTKW